MGKPATYTGGAWSVGGAMSARRKLTPLEEQHADKLAAWFHAQGRAGDDPLYARMADVLQQELGEIERRLAAERGGGRA